MDLIPDARVSHGSMAQFSTANLVKTWLERLRVQ